MIKGEKERLIDEQVQLLIKWNEENIKSNIEQVRRNVETISHILQR